MTCLSLSLSLSVCVYYVYAPFAAVATITYHERNNNPIDEASCRYMSVICPLKNFKFGTK